MFGLLAGITSSATTSTGFCFVVKQQQQREENASERERERANRAQIEGERVVSEVSQKYINFPYAAFLSRIYIPLRRLATFHS